MSTQTANLGLHQWEPNDHFRRTEFNEDFAKIDAAAAPRYVIGTFDADGAQKTIDLGFTPSAVLLSGKLGFFNHSQASGANYTRHGAGFAVTGAPAYCPASSGSVSSTVLVEIVEGGFRVGANLTTDYNPFRYIAFR